MGYQGGKLSDLFSTRPVRDAARSMAAKGGSELTDRAARHTPVRTGAVKAAWHELPTRRTQVAASPAYESGAANDHWRAPMVEHGVVEHETDAQQGGPAKAMTTPEGPRARAMHPGYPGAHMLAKAAAEVEAELPVILEPEVEGWARDTEATAKRHRWIR